MFKNQLPGYDYEIMFIDNCSQDSTREKLDVLCKCNRPIKAIFNSKNFGQFNSPFYGLCQINGDFTIAICADFQDPIELITLGETLNNNNIETKRAMNSAEFIAL